MLEKTGTLLLKVNYSIDEDSRTVRIDHPSLSGALGFEFTTRSLAEIQLQAVREDKEKTTVESLIDDTTEFVNLAKELKKTLHDLRILP